MKIVVLSDSHNSLSFDEGAFLAEKPDMLIHCGDGAGQAESLSFVAPCPVKYVCGNCDSMGKYFEVIEIEKHKIFVTHGHLYEVSSSLSQLNKATEENGCDIVLYGHTHIPHIELAYGKWFINPGSTSRPRDFYKPTYAVVNIIGDKIYPELKEI